MDKTIEVIIVAMVAIATAVGLMFIVRGQSGSFADFADGETSSAKCSLWEETCNEKYNDNCEGTLPASCDSQDAGGSSGTDSSIDCDTIDNPQQYAECSGTGIATD